jgi:hypothetical protein
LRNVAAAILCLGLCFIAFLAGAVFGQASAFVAPRECYRECCFRPKPATPIPPRLKAER